MLKRVKQVFAAVTAKISEKDKKFIVEHLNSAEERLFWNMNLPDQRHALNVAYTAIQLAKENQSLDREALIKSALLHDVGKKRGDVSTLDKIITVLIDKYAPAWAQNWGRQGRGNKLDNLRHAIFIYYHHPAISAAFLEKYAVSDEIIDLVLSHHARPTSDDCPELIILRRADNEH